MDIGLVVLSIAILFLLCFLIFVGVIYYQSSNADIPPGVTCRGKLRIIHGIMTGIAIVDKLSQKLGISSHMGLIQYAAETLMTTKLGKDPKLFIKDLQFEGVPVRVYQPKSPSAGGRKGVLFFHGGGWMYGNFDTYETLCRYVSNETDSVVVSVGYRLAPAHKYPAGFEDCLNATIHFLKTAEEYGVNSSSIVISGDSAGGNLAAAVCQALVSRADLPQPLAQVLIYPLLQMIDFNLPSYQQNRAVPLLYREQSVFFVLNYISCDVSVMEDVLDGHHVPVDMKLNFRKWLGADNIPDEFKVRGYKPCIMSSHSDDVHEAVKNALDSACSPLLAEDSIIRLLPKAYILTCEFDVLRDDGLLYKKRLEDNDIPVTWYHAKDGVHGIVSFFDNGKLTFPSGKQAVDNIVNFIRSV